MAVKASAFITITSVVDVSAVTRYYLLQSSTLAKPSKPTANPPSGSWTDTEPGYTSGSTNTLYFTDLTVFSNATWCYSAVSVSSAYEAAKEAYNRAITAQTAVDTLDTRVSSRGTQLVTNGTGMMGNNTNFSQFIYDPTVSCNGSNGSFTYPTKSTKLLDEYVALNPGVNYLFEFDARTLNGLSTMYSMIAFYDADKRVIVPSNHMYRPGTLTTLARDLNKGDTVVYLTDTSNWDVNTGTKSYIRGFIFWCWQNSFGYTYPENTYSRYTYSDRYTDSAVNKTNNTIALSAAWNGPSFPAGTKLSQPSSGGTYKYIGTANSIIPKEWRHVSAVQLGTVDYSGTNAAAMLPPGTAFARIGFYMNYNNAADTLWITNVSLKEDYQSAITAAQQTADEAHDIGDRNATTIRALSESVDGFMTNINQVSNAIQLTVEDHNKILSAMEFSESGLKIQMDGSIYYTLTDDTGYHIYQNNKEIAAFSEGKGKMDRLMMGTVVARKTSKGGWVWNANNT